MGKNTLLNKLLPLLLLTALPSIAQALDYTCTTNNGAITVTGYTGPGGNVSIPSEINGLLVNAIESGAFSYCTNLTSITIPDSVVSVGTYAFEWCYITNVTIGANVATIGDYAFSFCFSLTGITIPDSVVSIGSYAFYYCDHLTDVKISDSPTSIGQYAFRYCLDLKTAELGNCVTSIGSYAFWNCLDLTSVTVPDSVSSIGSEAFYACDSLMGVYFRGNSPSIGMDVFSSTATKIYYLPNTTGWGDTFAGRPTELWNPSIQTANENFGIQSNMFGFNIVDGPTNALVKIEACTNLFEDAWIPVVTHTITNGTVYFSDPSYANHPNRFYRLDMPD